MTTRWVSLLALGTTLAVLDPSQKREPLLLGVVVLNEPPPEVPTSGSIVTDPAKYQDIPGLFVVPFKILPPPPPPPGAPAAEPRGVLRGVVVDLGDGKQQPGDQPLLWTPPRDRDHTVLRVLLGDKPTETIVTERIPVARRPEPVIPIEQPYTMPVVGSQGGVQVIHGPTSGISTEMSIAVDKVPARIVAAKPGAVFWEVPEAIAPGRHDVVFVSGPGRAPVQLPLYVIELQMSADKTSLVRGESTQIHVKVTGLEGMPAELWRSELPPADLVNVKRLEQRGVRPPKPTEPGAVVLLVENLSPNTIRLGKRGDVLLLMLRQTDFAKGAFTYDDTLQSIRSGGFEVRGTTTTFLKPASVQRRAP